jgi:DEAD/DEAH box helicase domain-containing protein
MKKIVFDIETKNTFAEVGGRDPILLDLSVVVAYDYETDKYYSYQESELTKLWPLLEQADLIIGYNSNYFDIPILNKYYPGDLTRIKSLDLLEEIRKSLGKRISLDMVAGGTLGKAKSANGLQAVEWWKEGKIDEIIKYCEQDVRVTKEVHDYALANKELKYKLINEIKSFPIDLSAYDNLKGGGINYTLPF